MLTLTVRTALLPALTLLSPTTFNFSSSHIQLALSRNFILPTPSVHFAILLASLYSVLPMDLSGALSLKEERSKSLNGSSFQQHGDIQQRNIHTECDPRSSKGPVLDRQATLGKGRKTFLPRFTATKNTAATVNLWHKLSFRKVLGFTFQKCFKYSKDNLGRN